MTQFEQSKSDHLRLASDQQVVSILYDLGEHCIEFSDAVGFSITSGEGINESAVALALTHFAMYCFEDTPQADPRWRVVHSIQLRNIERVVWDPDGRTVMVTDLNTASHPFKLRCSEEAGRRFHLHSKLRRFFEDEVYQPLPSMVAICDLALLEERRRLLAAIREETARLKVNRKDMEALSAKVHDAAAAAATTETISAETQLISALLSQLQRCSSCEDPTFVALAPASPIPASDSDDDVTPTKPPLGNQLASLRENPVWEEVSSLEKEIRELNATLSALNTESETVTDAIAAEDLAVLEARRMRDHMFDVIFNGEKLHCRRERRHLYASEREGRGRVLNRQKEQLASLQVIMMREAAVLALREQEEHMRRVAERLHLAHYDIKVSQGQGKQQQQRTPTSALAPPSPLVVGSSGGGGGGVYSPLSPAPVFPPPPLASASAPVKVVRHRISLQDLLVESPQAVQRSRSRSGSRSRGATHSPRGMSECFCFLGMSLVILGNILSVFRINRECTLRF